MTWAWKSQSPLQSSPPAQIVSSILINELGTSLPEYTYVDFCAGGGGPTPSIERSVNAHLRLQDSRPVRFILTDLHPNVQAWNKVASKNPLITYEPGPVDASAAPKHLVRRGDETKTMRLFNLAFHHFDDKLAKAILKDTVETSDGFAIFELQDRSLKGMFVCLLFGIGFILSAPLHAWKWRSPITLFFSWVVPILPFVLTFDGWMSSLRSRTPDEVEALLRTCGADSEDWEIKSGSEKHLWPCGRVHWMICRPRPRTNGA